MKKTIRTLGLLLLPLSALAFGPTNVTTNVFNDFGVTMNSNGAIKIVGVATNFWTNNPIMRTNDVATHPVVTLGIVNASSIVPNQIVWGSLVMTQYSGKLYLLGGDLNIGTNRYYGNGGALSNVNWNSVTGAPNFLAAITNSTNAMMFTLSLLVTNATNDLNFTLRTSLTNSTNNLVWAHRGTNEFLPSNMVQVLQPANVKLSNYAATGGFTNVLVAGTNTSLSTNAGLVSVNAVAGLQSRFEATNAAYWATNASVTGIVTSNRVYVTNIMVLGDSAGIIGPSLSSPLEIDYDTGGGDHAAILINDVSGGNPGIVMNNNLGTYFITSIRGTQTYISVSGILRIETAGVLSTLQLDTLQSVSVNATNTINTETGGAFSAGGVPGISGTFSVMTDGITRGQINSITVSNGIVISVTANP